MTRVGSILLALCALLLSFAALSQLYPDIIAPPDPAIIEVVFLTVGGVALMWALAWLVWLAVDGK
jgi:hypothetical protein